MSVDILCGQALRDHHHLHVVQQLGYFHGCLVVTLKLSGHPHLGGLFYDLLPYGVYAGIEFRYCARACGTGRGTLAQFQKEIVERFHTFKVTGPTGQLTPSRSITKISVRPES